jgi:hypothetical protein
VQREEMRKMILIKVIFGGGIVKNSWQFLERVKGFGWGVYFA